MTKSNLPANKAEEVKPSERFTQMVLKEFTDGGGKVNITEFQRKLCQNYFIKIDQQLRDLELKRMAKSEKYREPLAYTWFNVNMQKLANDVVSFSSIGLDPAQPNHINFIPYKNSATNKYDIGFIMGYRGMEVKAMKYGLDVPSEVIVEVVHSSDTFHPIKKSRDTTVEGYTFEINEPFNRGDVVGGFYYISYKDHPEKNKLRIFSKADIEKRKPKNASAEFWGGEKDKWKWDDQKQKNVKDGTETVEGWYEEMCYKTIARAAYNSLTIDSQKIDENYMKVMERERGFTEAMIIEEISEKQNKGPQIGFTEPIEIPATTSPAAEEVKTESSNEGPAAGTQDTDANDNTTGPSF